MGWDIRGIAGISQRQKVGRVMEIGFICDQYLTASTSTSTSTSASASASTVECMCCHRRPLNPRIYKSRRGRIEAVAAQRTSGISERWSFRYLRPLRVSFASMGLFLSLSCLLLCGHDEAICNT